MQLKMVESKIKLPTNPCQNRSLQQFKMSFHNETTINHHKTNQQTC